MLPKKRQTLQGTNDLFWVVIQFHEFFNCSYKNYILISFFRSIAKEATLSSVSKKKSGKDSIVSSSDVEKLGRLATEIKSSEGVPDPSRDGKGLIFKRIQAHKSGPFDFEDIKVISVSGILKKSSKCALVCSSRKIHSCPGRKF